MKKNILCIALLIVSLTAFIVYTKHTDATTDKNPPKLYCESEEIVASVNEVTDEFLLKGVTAYDEECGDVSDSLMVQSISNFIQDYVIVTYAAVDNSNNVGRLERKLIYTDYKEPAFDLVRPLIFPAGTNVRFLGNIRANSVIDGDISTKIRYGLDIIVDNNTPATYPISFRVTDSRGKTSYLDTEIVIVNNVYTAIDITLSDYLIYIPQGSTFNKDTAKKYLKSASEEFDPNTELNIDCKVDTSTPGVYNVDYTINTGSISGKSRLVVVVEPD
ncbi:MAG: hypothetical protein E7566_06260 [Ruminococcaceae bacterium]|nr:hypothetical protein [Oscillospiraceae bacterium]